MFGTDCEKQHYRQISVSQTRYPAILREGVHCELAPSLLAQGGEAILGANPFGFQCGMTAEQERASRIASAPIRAIRRSEWLICRIMPLTLSD